MFSIVLRVFLVLLLIPVLYVIGNIIYAKWTYFDPPQRIVLIDNPSASALTQRSFTSLTWNIGYGGLGAKSDFFKDGGNMVYPEPNDFREYFDGIMRTLEQDSSDFQLLQEVDTFSKRSYFTDEVSFLKAQAYQTHPYSCFAENYKVQFVPVPFLKPMGQVTSGLLTLSKYAPYKVERHQLPGAFGFPDQLFFLRRCLLVYYYHHADGHDLVIINVHNSAYDDGSLKREEIAYMNQFIRKLRQKNNYIICGGDWNQCPPGFRFDELADGKEGEYSQSNLEKNQFGFGSWAYDKTTPTNRKNDKPYNLSKSFVTIIDFYWHSDNIEIVACKGENQKFKYSDHQPVKIEFRLKDEVLQENK